MAPFAVEAVTPHAGSNFADVYAPFRRNLTGVWVQYTSNTLAGDRQIGLQVFNTLDVLQMSVNAQVVQSVGLIKVYQFFHAAPDHSDFSQGYVPVSLPRVVIVDRGWKIRVLDLNNVWEFDTVFMRVTLGDFPS